VNEGSLHHGFRFYDPESKTANKADMKDNINWIESRKWKRELRTNIVFDCHFFLRNERRRIAFGGNDCFVTVNQGNTVSRADGHVIEAYTFQNQWHTRFGASGGFFPLMTRQLNKLDHSWHIQG